MAEKIFCPLMSTAHIVMVPPTAQYELKMPGEKNNSPIISAMPVTAQAQVVACQIECFKKQCGCWDHINDICGFLAFAALLATKNPELNIRKAP